MRTAMAGGSREGSYFFPEMLMKRLSGISDHSVSVVEAPSGFGKTTAVRECLKRIGGAALQSWYTCFGEQPVKVWERIWWTPRRPGSSGNAAPSPLRT